MKFSAFKKATIFIKKEWKKISISFLFAIIFWYSVSKFEYIEKKVYLPISYKNLPTNFIIVDGIESNAQIIIKAREDFFKGQNYTNLIKPIVYLENAKLGTFSYPIDVILNTPVQDISVKLQKDEVKLNIDEFIGKSLEIKPNISGIPAKGFFIEDLTLETQYIKIYGPKKTLSVIDFIYTETISVDNLNLSLITNVSLLIPPNCTSYDNTNLTLEIKVAPIHNTNIYSTN